MDELLEFPAPARRSIGYALRFAQAGAKTDASKPLKGFKGGGVLEIVEAYHGDAKAHHRFDPSAALSR